jgi:hypothetical protein
LVFAAEGIYLLPTLEFFASDGQHDSGMAQVAFAVKAVYDAPVAEDATVTT